MWRGLALIGLAACGFSGPPVTGESPIDAPTTIAACSVVPGPPSPLHVDNLGEQLGPTGIFANGLPKPPIVCAGDELPLGIGAYTTQIEIPEGGNPHERVVRSLTVRCGTLSFTSTGATAVEYAETIQTPYGGCEPQWGDDADQDVTKAPPASCPAGQVPVGLTGNGGGQSLFNTVAIACAALSPSGTIAATQDPIAVVDTGSYTNKPQHAICPPNTALVSFTWQGNCGIDELTPVCAALSCR